MAKVVFGQPNAGGIKPGEVPAATIRVEPDSDLGVERPGTMIGRYKLLEQIGEGGFGVVYMAEQLEPVQRKVALKVVKAGMDTKEVIARFEAERQALALMDHPNIAKILDAGVTGGSAKSEIRNPKSEIHLGRPYFVMELVKGIPITEFCDLKKLSPADRLQLFVKVCSAVQHAHQKGIIHRDIKPSNVLVTLHDGEPVPKVIDFGIAKALGPKLTEKTLFTGFAHLLGTPAYMSPEQAELSGLDIDTRSDIYSLGVLLYELLTGVTPFDAETLRKAALDEIRRMIREDVPPKPSTRLTQELVAAARQSAGDSSEKKCGALPSRRYGELQSLINAVRGDLDWIVMKCLEKDRKRRYETANGLAMDVQRHLTDEPIVARPPSKLYEFQKTVRRHKFGFAAAGAIGLVLLAGVVVSTWQAVRATRAERVAEMEAERSKQVAQFMKDMLKAAGPSVARGRDATLLKEVLEKTAERIETDLKDQPEVRGDLWYTLGTTFQAIGDRNRAIPMYEAAVADFRLALGEEHQKLALALGNLGYCQSFTGDLASGSNNAALGLEMARKCGDSNTLAACLGCMGRSLHTHGRIPGAGEPFFREAVALHRGMTNDLSHLASALVIWAQSQQPENEALMKEAIELYRTQSELDATGLGGALFALGQLLLETNRNDDAELTLEEATDLISTRWDKSHPYQPLVRAFYARALLRNVKPAKAEAVLREGLERGLPKYNRSGYFEAWSNALAFQNRGDEALVVRMRMSEQTNALVLQTIKNLSHVLLQPGQMDEATRAVREQFERLREKFPPDDPQPDAALGSLMAVLLEWKRLAAAEIVVRERLRIRREYLPPDDRKLDQPLVMLTQILIDQEKFADAEIVARDSLALREKIMPDRWFTFNTKSVLGGLLVEQKQHAEAEPLLLSGYEGLKQREDVLPAAGKICLSNSLQRLVQLYEAWGKPVKAVEWKQKLAEFENPKP